MPRSIRVNPFPPAGGSRRRRRRAASIALAALATLTLAGPAATPAHAIVMDKDSYMACVNAVADWTDTCRNTSPTLAGDIACVLAGTAGILGCAALEVIEQLAKGITLQ